MFSLSLSLFFLYIIYVYIYIYTQSQAKCFQPACFALPQALVPWASRWLPPSWHGYHGFCEDRSLCVAADEHRKWHCIESCHACRLEELLTVLTRFHIYMLIIRERILGNSGKYHRIRRSCIKCIARVRMFLGGTFLSFMMRWTMMDIRSNSTCSAATATSCHFFTHRYAKATEGLKDRLIWHGSWSGTDEIRMVSCCFFINSSFPCRTMREWWQYDDGCGMMYINYIHPSHLFQYISRKACCMFRTLPHL